MKCKFLICTLIIIVLLSGCYRETQKTQSSTHTNISGSSTSTVENNSNTGASSPFSQTGEYKINKPKSYLNEKYKFSVDYPEAWTIAIDPDQNDKLPNGDPQNGINIYIDSNKKDSIYVFGQNGHIGIPPDGLKSGKFTTDAGVSGDILFRHIDGTVQIYLVLGDGFIGATMNASESSFNKNESQILGILKSIKINNQ